MAAYFCCSEALQNAVKHAGAGARATVSLSVADDALRFEVADDGAGFDTAATADGHRADRACGTAPERSAGAWRCARPPAGTVVSGMLPLPTDDGAALGAPAPLPEADEHGGAQLVLGQHREGAALGRRPRAARSAVAEISTTSVRGRASRTRRVASMPSMPGRRTSIRTRSMSSRRAAATPSSPVLASATLQKPGVALHQEARGRAEALLVVDRQHAHAVGRRGTSVGVLPATPAPHTRPR